MRYTALVQVWGSATLSKYITGNIEVKQVGCRLLGVCASRQGTYEDLSAVDTLICRGPARNVQPHFPAHPV